MPNPLRLALETELNLRVGGLTYFVYVKAWDHGRGASPSVVPTGDNPVYNGAIGWALDLVGSRPVSYGLVIDSDLEKVSSFNESIVTDLAEYRMIANALGNYVQPDVSASGRSQAWGSLRSQFQDRMNELAKMYAAYIKVNQYVIGYGSIRLPIAPGPSDLYPGPY